MKPVLVSSSNIRSMQWAEDKTLTVEFNSGGTYVYQNVSKALFADIITADSVGSAFSKTIRSNPEVHPFAIKG